MTTMPLYEETEYGPVLTKYGQACALQWIMQHDCADYYCTDHDECAVCRCEPECLDKWIED